MSTSRPIRVIVAKPGLDGHDRGAKVVARALRDAGMEVIYTGVRQTPENIVAVAIDEDVDCIWLSVLSGTHLEYMQAILDLLAEREGQDIAVIIGGIISDDDAVQLTAMGAAAVFGPRSSTGAIVEAIERIVAERDAVVPVGNL